MTTTSTRWNSLSSEYPVVAIARRSAPTYLNLRKASIYGGSNEIQRQIISRTILGL